MSPGHSSGIGKSGNCVNGLDEIRWVARVDRAAAVAPIPGAADVRLALEAVDREPLLAKVLDGDEATRAGADHANGFNHGRRPAVSSGHVGRGSPDHSVVFQATFTRTRLSPRSTPTC